MQIFFFSRSQFPFNVIRSIWASVPNIIFFRHTEAFVLRIQDMHF